MCQNVSNGVRQGGILSPYLFSVYVDDLSFCLTQSETGCSINNIFVNHLFYADDLCLLAPSASGLQSLLNTCTEYGLENDIIYNPIKSIALVIKPARFKLKCPDVFLGKHKLEYHVFVKYLGFIIKEIFCDDDDMSRQLRSLYYRANSLLQKFNKCSIEVKKTLFNSYCASMYCPHLWVNYTKCMYNKLKVAYNNVFRRLLGYRKFDSASHMFVTNRLDNFEVKLRKSVYKFMQRLTASNNDLISTLSAIDQASNGMWYQWSKSLYTNYHMNT